jgi:hypothetical protein
MYTTHINLPNTETLYPLHRELDQNYHLTKTTFCNSIISIVQCTQGAECGAMKEGRPAKSLIKLSWCLINKTVERLDKNPM